MNQESYIYKLVSPETDKCYIGSTKICPQRRLWDHALDYDRYSNSQNARTDCFCKNFCTSVEIMKYRDVAIVVVETLHGASKRALLAREAFHIKNTPNCVNKNLPHTENRTYVECICGGTVQYDRKGVKQHFSGRKHEVYMGINVLEVFSFDGKTKVFLKDVPVKVE